MKKLGTCRLLLCLIFLCSIDFFAEAPRALAQNIPLQPMVRKKWTAQWVSHPTAALRDPIVLHFRKVVPLETVPSKFIVHVSGDNRFVFYVNGVRVGEGPARGDLGRWRYETYDLAPLLKPGDNVLAATVWQFGVFAPLAQFSDRAAFLVEGDTAAEQAANTGKSWQVEQEMGQAPQKPMPEGMWQYWAAGPGERVDGELYDWSWKSAVGSVNSHWVDAAAAVRESIYPQGSTPVSRMEDTGLRWALVPDPLPQMEYTEVPSGKVVRATLPAAQFPEGSVTIPADTDATILVDHGVVLTAYPELTVSGGKGASIEMMYTEALYNQKQERFDRAAVEGLQVIGLHDNYIADGGSQHTYTSLWWRTWRFVQLHIKTGAQPLTLERLRTFYTAYPFQDRGSFASSDPELARIREICWRTARLDAHETYMDSAYWEQLQYIGDTRLQALISYTIGGDDRLGRQALQAFDDSRIPEGITLSRYPTSLAQYIPPFSLLYVNMLHDYWMYRPDASFAKELLPGTRSVLNWFLVRQRADGMLKMPGGWDFVDSPAGFPAFPSQDAEGRSAPITLQFIGALQDAADLEEALGDPAIAAKYRHEAKRASDGLYRLCWDPARGLIADTPDKKVFSQHSSMLSVLHDVIPKDQQKAVMERVLSDPGLAHVSLVFQFYLIRALEHAGMGDRYLPLLGPWRQMLAKHQTTTPEYPDPTRSETHAWSAHPAYDFVTVLAGIRPDAPGFARVRIAPNLGTLSSLDVSMPAPQGAVETSYRKSANGVDATITLPAGLPGSFVWKGKSYPLKSGKQELHLQD